MRDVMALPMVGNDREIIRRHRRGKVKRLWSRRQMPVSCRRIIVMTGRRRQVVRPCVASDARISRTASHVLEVERVSKTGRTESP